MKRVSLPFICSLCLLLLSCAQVKPPKIKSVDSNEVAALEQKEELFKQRLEKFLNQKNSQKQKRKSLSLDWGERTISLFESWMKPDYLDHFKSEDLEKIQKGAQFLGNYGACHQFRVFYTVDLLEKQGQWMSSILTLPAAQPRRFYKSSSDIEFSAAVLAPTLDGPNYLLEPAFWSFLCKNKVASLMPESVYKKNSEDQWEALHFDPSPEPEAKENFYIFEESLKNYVLVLEKNRKLLSKINELKVNGSESELSDFSGVTVSKEKHFLWASSLGSLASSIVVSKDSSLKAAVLGVGGGDLANILSKSQIKIFKETRSYQMNYYHLQSSKDYENFLRPHLKYDPLGFAHESLKNKIFMYLAEKDVSVPSYNQELLWNAFGRPKHERIKLGHVETLLYVAWLAKDIKQRALNLFKESLDSKQSKTPL